MLQVQVEIVNTPDRNEDLAILGLNDIAYIVPEFTPSKYESIYEDQEYCFNNHAFQSFFKKYKDFEYVENSDNLPERMGLLDKNLCVAIEHDEALPELRGKAFINLKNIPNGHYSVLYVRIGQPI